MLSLEDITDYLGVWDKKPIFEFILNFTDHTNKDYNIDFIIEEY